MKSYSITISKHRVIIKKIDNLIIYAHNKDMSIDDNFLKLANFIKTNNCHNVTNLQAREMEEYTKNYNTMQGNHSFVARASELIRYSNNRGFKLSSMFYDDLEKLKNDEVKDEKIFIKSIMRKYIRNVWREENIDSIKEDYYYLTAKQKNKKGIQFTKINKPIEQVELKGRNEKLFNRIEKVINIPKIISEVKSDNLSTNKEKYYEEINTVLYNSLEENTLKCFLYSSNYKIIRNFIIKKVSERLEDLTKHDKDLNPSTLSKIELKQAINTSITKFIEIYYQQPKELKSVLIPYENTPLSEYTEVTQSMIKIEEDFNLLTKLFKEHKRDTKGRVYNYSLFAFLYYAYGVYVSFEHLYNSELLKLLGAYTFKKDRQKPILKNKAKNILQQHQEATKVYQQEDSIYLEYFMQFVQTVNTKHMKLYTLSYLVDLSHELTASKEYVNRLRNTPYNFKNVTYQTLPQPIKNLLLPIEKLQIA